MEIGIGLRPNAVRDIESSTKDYAWLGEIGDQIAAGVSSSEERVQRHTQAFEEVGCDEVIFIPASKDPAQVDLLADAVGLGK